MYRFHGLTTSDRVNQRYHELELKVKAAIKDNLGDSVEETVYIDGLATKPAAQGQGYASALMRAVLFTVSLKMCPSLL